MQPTPNKSVTRKSSLNGRKTEFGLHSGALAHLMNLLSDLYTDLTEAVIRETANNALDAHIAAGQSRPIEISLPTNLNPVFVVQDHGIGMSLETVETVYTQYGYSTKQAEGNEETGALGLGSKAPLAYTDQFTLVTIKDGERVTAIIGKNAKGVGEMEVVDWVGTDEPNGTRLQIPVLENMAEFNERAAHIFKFWEPGKVLVNGKAPVTPTGTALDPDILLADSGVQGVYVVMGNVPYRVTQGVPWGLHSSNIVARVPLRSVEFTPARDGLKYTDLTRDTLATLWDVITAKLNLTAQAEVAAAASRYEALVAANKWSNAYSTLVTEKDLTYNGGPLVEYYKAPAGGLTSREDDEDYDGYGFYLYKPNARYGNLDKRSSLRHTEFPDDYAVITGFTNKLFSSTVRDRIKDWMREVDVTGVLVQEYAETSFPWAKNQPTTVATWAEVKAATKPAKSESVPSSKTTYRTILGDDQSYLTLDELPTKNLLYFVESEHKTTERSSYYGTTRKLHRGWDNANLRTAFPDHTIVSLTNSRQVDKFTKHFPKAKHVRDAVTPVATSVKKKLTDTEVLHLSDFDYPSNWGDLVDPNELDDPKAAEFARKAQTGTSSGSTLRLAQLRALRTLGSVDLEVDTPDSLRDLCAYVQTTYPLVALLSTHNYHNTRRARTADATIYINQIHTLNNLSTGA